LNFSVMSGGIRWLADRKLSWGFVSRQRFVLHASKVAAAAGMHKYQPRAELERELRETCAAPSSDVDSADRARLGAATDAAVAAAMAATLAVGVAVDRRDALALATARVADARGALAADAQDESAAQRVGRALGMRLGETGEPVVRAQLGLVDDALAPASGCAPYVISADPVPVGPTHTTPEPAPAPELHLGGRLDGLRRDADGGLTIVEIKTRVNRLLGVPTYERVQIHAYMFIHGTRRGRLVENFKSRVVEHVVDFDDVFWAGVTAALGEFWQRVLDFRPAE
jgi:hypothetical protein